MSIESGTTLDRVQAKWNSNRDGWWGALKNATHWLQHPRVQTRVHEKVTGGRELDKYGYFVDKYLAGRTPLKRCLTLGCGEGELERGLAKYNLTLQHDAVDISEAALARAQTAARQAGFQHIHYRAADLNTVSLPPDAFDVVFGVSAVHHVQELEHLFAQVDRSLKPQGYFFLDEFVGPSQFQWTDAQLAAANVLLNAIPARLRTSWVDRTTVKGSIRRPTIEEMNADDPSEAIRSSEIIECLSSVFDVVETRGYGGTLLQLVLKDIVGNFSTTDAEATSQLDFCFAMEDHLLALGHLTHDFRVIVARKRTAPTRP